MSDLGELVRRVLDGLPVGVWVAEAKSGTLAYANDTFREIMGTSALDDVEVGGYSEPYGICTLEGEPYPEERMPFVRALEAGGPVVVDDIVIHRHDGGRVNIRAWATPLRDAAGAITHVAIAFSDITAQVAAEAARRESEEHLHRAHRLESVGQLAGGVAHDFNNLLTAIAVVANSLARRATADFQTDLERILDATDRAMSLTRSLLDFAGRSSQSQRPVDLHELISSLCDLLRRTLDSRIDLRVELEATSGAVIGDQSQYEQVVMNLVLNARDAIEDRGVIAVATCDEVLDEGNTWGLGSGAYVKVAVDDSGAGIPDEIRSQIFDPYFTTKTSGARHGSGLGLATVARVVEAAAGRVRLADSPLGGARFEVLLPSSSPFEVAPAHEPQALREGVGSVLVVDDDELVRVTTTRALETMGYSAFEAGSGREAVARCAGRSGEMAAVLLDLVMPDMDGKATFLALRAIDPEVPIILMSGYRRENETTELLALGAGSFLAKPFTLDDLSQRLASLRRV